jgi:hypothetical protein
MTFKDARMADNIERVEWTLQDPDWKPSRQYVEKMLAAYKTVMAEVERLTAERDLWKERTEQGSLIIKGNVAEIERLLESNGAMANLVRRLQAEITRRALEPKP